MPLKFVLYLLNLIWIWVIWYTLYKVAKEFWQLSLRESIWYNLDLISLFKKLINHFFFSISLVVVIAVVISSLSFPFSTKIVAIIDLLFISIYLSELSQWKCIQLFDMTTCISNAALKRGFNYHSKMMIENSSCGVLKRRVFCLCRRHLSIEILYLTV